MWIDAARRILPALVLVALPLTLAATAAGAEPRIAWKVENSFRFFLDPADTEVHRATWTSLSESERKSPVLAAERLLAERHQDGWSATMFAKTCWDPVRNAYSCRERADYLNPRSHTVLARMEGLDDAQTVDCAWLTRPQGRGPRGKVVTLPCDTPVQLEIPYPGGAWITVEIGGRQIAEIAARVTDLLIVGMGDSFASGEGNPDVPVRFSPDRAADYDAGTRTYMAKYPGDAGQSMRALSQEVLDRLAGAPLLKPQEPAVSVRAERAPAPLRPVAPAPAPQAPQALQPAAVQQPVVRRAPPAPRS